MRPSISEIKEILAPGQLIILTCKKPVRFNEETGYAGKNDEDSFEFLEVINKYEHFSNISDPPETKAHLIRYADVIALMKHP